MADRSGQQFGNYRLVRLLGRGGFAEVYLGEHLRLKTQAAIKVLHTSLEDNDVEGFLQEAQTVARLKHPHIVRVFDFDIEAQIPFLVMDYLPMGNVRRSHPKGTALPLEKIVSYVTQVASALQYAHDQKLIHRDIKPENLLLDKDNIIVLSDFGIALMTQSSRYQNTQEVAGTAAYMAPEQLQGHPHRASDQYALGVVVYEWLTGDRPFHGSFSEIASQHMFVPPPPLRERVPMISPAIEQVVLTAMEKDPHKRFASVQAFATALERANEVATTLPVTLPTQIFMPHQIGQSADTAASTSLSQSVLPTEAAIPPSQSVLPTEAAIPPIQSVQATNLLAPTSPLSEPSVAETASSAPIFAKAHSNVQGEEILFVTNSQITEKPILIPKSGSDTGVINHHRGLPKSRIILLIGLALLVIVSSVGFFSLIRANQIATDNAHMPIRLNSLTNSSTTTPSSTLSPTPTQTIILTANTVPTSTPLNPVIVPTPTSPTPTSVVTLTPASGAAGSTIQANGTRWPQGEQVDVYWKAGSHVASVNPDATGHFQVSVQVPSSLSLGRHQVWFDAVNGLTGKHTTVYTTFQVTSSGSQPWDCNNLSVPAIAFYAGKNFAQPEICFEGSGSVNLQDYGWANRAQSINVGVHSGCFFDGANETGHSWCFSGSFTQADLGNWDSRIVSFQIN